MIDNFKYQYAFLSNFYWFQWDARPITVEHWFQAAKTDSPDWKARILRASTPAMAKKFGRQAPMRPHWEEDRVEVMRACLREKFSFDHIALSNTPELAQKLVDTGNQELVEGNTWGDTFWGVCKGVGENWLGQLLMQRREELRESARRG